jgi:hypothetical protein
MMDTGTPLIITGMHRSGTSLLAGFVHHSGINMGEDLLGTNKSNEYGHFEDVEILEFHRSVLQRNFGHQMWVPGPPCIAGADRVVAETLVEERRRRAHWGWKDPRTTLFLEFWADLLPGARYLFVVRRPDLVVDSLRRRAGNRFYQFWIHGVYMRSWLIYNQECYRFFTQQRNHCLLVMLERVLEEPGTFVELLSNWLAFDFSESLFHSMYDGAAIAHRPTRPVLLSPTLRRQSWSFFGELQENADL